MKVYYFAVGRKLEPSLQAQCDTYAKRLQRWFELDAVLLAPSHLQAEQARNEESARILEKLLPSDFVVLLDERGMLIDSAQLSDYVSKWRAQQGRLIFIIGGAYGVNEELRKRADYVWSLSPLVFPHELVRVLLHEQLYRALCIEHNIPYHHV